MKMPFKTTAGGIRRVLELDSSIAGFQLRLDADRLVLSREPVGDVPALRQLGRPGLWKLVTNKHLPLEEFTVPLYVVDQMGEADDDPTEARLCCLQRAADWARATAADGVKGWVAPELADVKQWITPELMTVQCADMASQGHIDRTNDRLAVSFQIVANIPASLSPARMAKLEALLLDAHNTFHMTRVGLRTNEDGSQSAMVEMDFTGAPHAAIGLLLRYSIDALHHIVRWCGASAAVIANENACSAMLD